MPVAQDRDLVRNALYFVQLVRGEQNGDTRGFQVFDLFKQNFGFAFGEHGCRFVHDQHFGLARQCFGDFDHLLVGVGDITHPRGRVDRAIQPGKQRAGLGLHRCLVQKQATLFLVPKEDVLFNAQQIGKVEFLMDLNHTLFFGIL